MAAGREELLTAEEAAALLAAPTPLALWRKKRDKTQAQLAAEVGVSQNFLSDLERGKAKGDVRLYVKLARSLKLSIDDLAPESERKSRQLQRRRADFLPTLNAPKPMGIVALSLPAA